MPNIKLFSGSSNPQLAEKIAHHLSVPLGKATVSHFSDGESMIEILENVRGKEIFIIQSICAPAADHLMELLFMADALKRSSAKNITAVMPYFGYARQDRRDRSSRVPISAKVVADMLMGVGVNNVMTVDLHADQIQGFFSPSTPLDNAYGSQVMMADIKSKKLKNLVVVSPDVGGVARARAVAKRLNDARLAIIDKRRPKANQAKVMNIIGEITGLDCVIIDDMIDTAGTLSSASKALMEAGASSVTAYCTHPILSGDAISNIENSMLTEVVVTDSIPLSKEAQDCNKIRQLGLGELIAETIIRVTNNLSVSSMYAD